MKRSVSAKQRQPGSDSRRRPSSVAGRAALVLAVTLAGSAVLLPGTAEAATTLTVTTTADISASAGACGNTSITTPPSPLSLREATCLANNLGGAVTINVPAGHYFLPNGELQPGLHSGQNVTIAGAGSASTIIDAQQVGRVFDIDVNSVGGVTASLSGLTVTNGVASSVGGGGILGGSATSTTADSLTVANSVISNNESDYGTPTDTGQYGGGLQFEGGSLTLNNVTVSGNQSHSSWGSGVDYRAGGFASPESLTITNSTFANNDADLVANGGNSGGALYASGTGTSLNVTNSKFVGNLVSSTGTEQAAGAAILSASGNLTVTGTTFTGNTLTASGAGGIAGGAAVYSSGTATLHYDRITGNTGQAVTAGGAGAINAGDDWWGCNTGPNTTGCDTAGSSGITSLTSFLKLAATASPAHVMGPNGTATITATLTTDSLGAAVGASNLAGAFDTLPVTFGDPPGDATVAASTAALSSGQASVGYNSHTTLGPDNDTVTLDNATVSAAIEVDEAPAITSPNTARFDIGAAGSFTITTTGYPNAALTESGALPAGLTFADQGNGTAKITGTASGAGGNYPITITANNGYSPNATQTLTLSVGQPPAFTSGSTATFNVGTAGSFTVTTSGVPTVSTITESGGLPAGVTFADNGNGTATFAGTPTGTGATYPVTLTATNGVAPNATQNLTIQVNQAPAVTTNPTDQTVQPGNPVTFSAAASGVPAPTVQWQVSTDGGASFSNIGGASSTTYTFTTGTGDDGNQYRAVFTNAAGTATTTAATLSVGTAPAFTSADNTTFVVGNAGNFTITTSGVPNATLSRSGTGFPAWLTLTDNGDGTGTLTGTPPAGSGGSYTFTLKAANGFSPSASQSFTLFVDQSPVITSADHTTFTVGSAADFAVTTTAGYPTSTTLTETGSLPSGVTFTDNGDGSATLGGTPAVGTGGSYSITVRAVAGIAPAAVQSFTLTVLEPPRIISPAHAAFAVGTAGSFTVTTAAGNPSATTLTKSGTLPSGVGFTDNGNGTATIVGTPNVGSGGVYTLTLTASNGISPDASQTFTLTVNEPPRITSADHATFTEGTAEAFTVTTTAAEPSAVTITGSGSLPAGLTFTDNGDGTATLGGNATAGGSYPITITASNGVLPNATQSFTLTVNDAPVITSADHTTFAVASPGTFTVTTTPGTPSDTTLTEAGNLPAGVDFQDNGDGTATLAGTPAAGTGGSYPLTFTAGNGPLASTQSFMLTVTDVPVITSADHATFTIAKAGNFAVETVAGFPPQTSLTETGGLPSGVSFTDNGDGTATLAGTPAAGTGGSYPITITAINGAGSVDQAFTLSVVKHPQAITVTSGDPGTGVVGGGYTPAATSDSGLPVAYSLDQSTSGQACSFDGTTVSFDHVGTCVVDFDQPGNDTYAAAPQQQVRIAVGAIATTTTLTPTPADAVYGQPVDLTAVVAAGQVNPAGTVQFAVDGIDLGAPVALAGGSAAAPDPGVLAPGAHTVSAAFIPAAADVYGASQALAAVTVAQAATTTTLSVARRAVSAAVAPVAPGAGTPTGAVHFSVDGRPLGTTPLVNGVARLPKVVPAGATREVAAVYAGDADFTGSSASTARHDPSITATLSSRRPASSAGWYRTPVTVRFSCTTNGAPLTRPCPEPVPMTRNAAGQSVTRTVTAVDGGAATAAVTGINIDQHAPAVRITGVRNGGTYAGRTPQPRCVAHDGMSGVASCTLADSTAHGWTRVLATATDRAGNVAHTRISFRSLPIYLSGAPYRHNRFTVRPGRTYTIVVSSVLRPRYYDATVYPRRPRQADHWFHRAGARRWALGVTMQRAMRSHPLWNIGVKIGGTLHVLTVRVR